MKHPRDQLIDLLVKNYGLNPRTDWARELTVRSEAGVLVAGLTDEQVQQQIRRYK